MKKINKENRINVSTFIENLKYKSKDAKYNKSCLFLFIGVYLFMFLKMSKTKCHPEEMPPYCQD